MATDAEISDVKKLVQSLSRASGQLSPHEMRQNGRVVECGKDALSQSFRSLLGRIAGSPALTSKSADCTPLKAVKRVSTSLPSGQHVSRSGKECLEILVKNQFLRAFLPDGSSETRLMLQDPIHLSNGKKTDAIFQACVKDWLSLRQCGHAGLALEHYVFDRCGLTALERRLRQWHQLQASNFDHLSQDLPPEVFRLTEFVIVTPCAGHDAHNSFKWAVRSRFEQKDLMRDIYISIESLRNSMDLLTGHLSAWVAQNLTFVPDLPPSLVDERKALWDVLNVGPEVAELLAETLQLMALDGRICVAESARHLPDLVGMITATLLAAWDFRRWTESRFLTVGHCARGVVAALLTGLQGLVSFIKADPSASLFYLNGFSRLSGIKKTFLVECAIVSRVSDAALGLLMEDNRVVKQYDALCLALAEEQLWVSKVRPYTWDCLAAVGETEAETLRSECIAAAHTSFHFFWRRVLQPAGELPWSLARGDLDQNLETLAAAEKPAERIAQQIWLLLKVGYNRVQLRQLLRLLGEVPWTNLIVEQQHGSLAALRRFHPEYGQETLCCRATLKLLSRLLPQHAEEERQLEDNRVELAKLRRKQPEKAGGRQLFIAEGFQHIQSVESAPEHAGLGFQKKIFQELSHEWSDMPWSLRDEYSARARTVAVDNRKRQHAEMEALREKRAVLQLRSAASVQETRPISFSQAAFSEAGLAAFAVRLSSQAFRGQRLEALRLEAMRAPLATSGFMKVQLDRQPLWFPDEPEMPEWARQVAAQRDHFKDTAFVISAPDGEDQSLSICLTYNLQQLFSSLVLCHSQMLGKTCLLVHKLRPL